MNLEGQMIKIAGVTLKGEPLDGTYPMVRIDADHVVVAHPVLGNLKVPRARTDLPASAGVTLSYDDLLAEIRSKFDILHRLTAGIIEGKVRSLIVSGAPGVGKTFSLEAQLSAAVKNGKIKKYTVIRGTISPIGLFICLHEHRHAGSVLVLDDCDQILEDLTGCNIIKAATDSGKKRTISYVKAAYTLEVENVPKSYEFSGSLVFVTNLDMEKIVSENSKQAPHLSAVLNRANYLDLCMHSQQALMARIEDVARTTPMLRDEGLNDTQIESLILWIKENAPNVRSLSLRTAMLLASHMTTDPVGWKDIAKATLLRARSR